MDGLGNERDKMKKIVIFAIRKVFNPAILWCFGWKYESQYSHGIKFYCWIDPKDGVRYSQERAIEICESRIDD